MKKKTIIATAPTRADLAGGTLDLWPLYCFLNSGLTLNFGLSLQQRVEVGFTAGSRSKTKLLSPLGEKAEWVGALELSKIEALPHSTRFPAYLITSWLRSGKKFPKGEISIEWKSDVPMGSGLGGSSTLAIAFIEALSQLSKVKKKAGWEWEWMAWARDMEAGFLHTPTGTQDYLGALFGGVSSYISDFGGMKRKALPARVISELDERFVLVFSGEQHHSGRSNWEVFQKAVDKNKDVIRGFSELGKIAQSMQEALSLKKVNWKAVGQLVTKEWNTRRELFQVDTPKLNAIFSSLMEIPGVWGAKVCGAAQGGSFLVIVDPALRAEVREKCKQKSWVVLDAKVSKKGVSARAR